MKTFDHKLARKFLPKRKLNDNKSTAGKAYIVAGSKGMYGAAVLSATAACRVGAGYSYLVTHKSDFPTFKHPDFLNVPWNTFLKIKNVPIAIGPGLGISTHTLKIIKHLIKYKFENVVIDADALNTCAKYKLLPLPSTWIATPHEGELSRLIGVTSVAIRKDRKKYAALGQKKLGCVLVLKGPGTLVAAPNKMYRITSGNPALAKAGTGDVLTGMIVGLLAQKIPPVQAACLAAFIHGKMADEWIKKKDILSLMASDLLEQLPLILKKMRK